LVILFALPAFGQYTRDAAANRKIDEAINTHYLATDFDKAEAVLTGTIKACEDKCSPATLAKAWMYVGIVRGSGRNDQAGAKEAFTTALATDPNVKLDAGLATPETQATFAGSGGGGAAEPAAPPASGKAGKGEKAAAAPAGDGEVAEGNGVTCTPAVTEVETRRNIPVQCQVDEEVTSVELRYKAFGAETWKSVKMEHKGQSFRAQIPCDATQTAGVLKLYVHGKNATGADTVNWGSKSEPIEISLVEQSTMEPPSFDDADAPPRCAAKEICPPDFPGCDSGKSGGTKDWGAECDNSSECKSGLLCMDGTCETAPSCSTNSDCSIGTCQDGKCAVEEGAPASGPGKKWWIGAHFGLDFAFVGGQDICLAESQSTGNWACYWSGSTDKPYDPAQMLTEGVGNVGSGAVLATKRIMLSVDRVLTPNITAGLRLGYALGGGPPAGRQVQWGGSPHKPPGGSEDNVVSVTNAGKAFFPVHAEVRVGYWFGKNVFGKRGLRPYVHVGGGVAQVDAKVVVQTADKYGVKNPADGKAYTADAWKKLGTGFITAGGGAVWAFTPKMGAQLNLNAMMMLGASGLVLEPSLGLVYGL
jgi:hypothetical protein